MSLFTYSCKNQFLALLVYVDDIIITGPDPSLISQVVKDLNTSFALKDLGALHYFLGIEVYRDQSGLFLTQSKYVSDLLAKHHMTTCKPCSTPASPSVQLSATIGDPLQDVTSYRSVIGALQYLTMTRPDIAFIVNKLSQFLHCPTSVHWQACKRVLRYLKGSLATGLHLQPVKDQCLIAFSDADWAGSIDDRRSTSGYCIFLGPNLISWSSKKQHVVARSSTESEYRALAHAAAEITWLQSLLTELPVPQHSCPIIWCDNLGAASLASNLVVHARTKHIEI